MAELADRRHNLRCTGTCHKAGSSASPQLEAPMRIPTAIVLLAAATFLTMPIPSADAGGLFYRDRAPARAYYAAPAPAYYYAPARAYRRDRMRSWCLFDWFRFDKRRW